MSLKSGTSKLSLQANRTDPDEWANRIIRRPDLFLFNHPKKMILECKICYYPAVAVDLRHRFQYSTCSNCYIAHAVLSNGKDRIRYKPVLPGKGWKTDTYWR